MQRSRFLAIRVGWWFGGTVFVGLLWFFLYYNRKSVDALSAVNHVGSVLVAIYGLFVLSDPQKQKTGRLDVLKILLIADVALAVEAVTFVGRGAPRALPRDITVSYIWDAKSGDMFPDKSISGPRGLESYASLAERIIKDCVEKQGALHPDVPRSQFLPGACGLLPGTQLTELVLLEYVGVIFKNSWEARPVPFLSLYGAHRVIENYMGGQKGKVVTRDDVLRVFQSNPLIEFVNSSYGLTIPPDVELRRLKSGTGLLLDGDFCDVEMIVTGASAGARYPTWEGSARITEVGLHLQGSCSNFRRGHPQMDSRANWASTILETVAREFSNEALGAK